MLAPSRHISLGRDFAYALDPALFAEACGLTPDPWQADLLRSTAPRALLNCARQTGKSTTTGVVGLHTAKFQGGTVVIASPSQRQSMEMLRTIKGFLTHLGTTDEVTAENLTRLEFKNGARILAVPGDERTIRGIGGVSLVLIDEAARIPDDLISAISPMLATTGGRLICLSTPAGRRGFFHDQWHSQNDWLRIKVAAKDCPRISQSFLDEELKNLGVTQFSQEYELAFIADGDAAFNSAIIEAAMSRDFEPFFPGGI
jgi:hypothetical protein